MAGYFYLLLVTSCVVSAAPPSQQRAYPSHAPSHLAQGSPLDFYLEHPGADNYYRPAEQNQVNTNDPNEEASRLESLEPDSEVELVPGVQQPQTPPQQNPVAPNIPGLLPGQRVFIVHMPVPGYSPGTIGGYQPVYIVAAGAQGNNRYPGNGYQNGVILDPSGQAVISPLIGYGQRGFLPPQLLGIQNPYNYLYQNPGIPNNPAGQSLQGNAERDAIHFTNGLGFQGPPVGYQRPVAQLPHPNNKERNVAASAQQKQSHESVKEAVEQKPNHRGSPALLRNKA